MSGFGEELVRSAREALAIATGEMKPATWLGEFGTPVPQGRMELDQLVEREGLTPPPRQRSTT